MDLESFVDLLHCSSPLQSEPCMSCFVVVESLVHMFLYLHVLHLFKLSLLVGSSESCKGILPFNLFLVIDDT
jgi:hypothetical protein